MTALRVPAAIARFEAPRLLRHPLVVLGLVASVGLLWLDLRAGAPVLERDSVELVGRLLPVAAAVLVVVHGLATRARRERTTELLDSLPARADQRVRGEALAAIGPVAATLVILAVAIGFLLLREPIGQLQWLELAGAPAMVLLACAFGLALAQWLPARVTVFVALVGLVCLQAWASPYVGWEAARGVGGVAPFHQMDVWQPYAMQARAPDVRLAWLLALTGIALSVSVLRWRRRAGIVVAAMLTSAVALVTGASAARTASVDAGPPVEPALVAPDVDGGDERVDVGAHVCVERDGLALCAFPGYEDWIPLWHHAVRQVTDVVPVPIDRVRQATGSFAYTYLDDEVVTSMWWDGPGGQEHRFELAVQVAMRAVATPGHPDITADRCLFGGEARAAIALWLAGRGDPALTDELRRRVEASRGKFAREVADDGSERVVETTSLWLGAESVRIDLGVPDGDLALAMLALPEQQVRSVVLDDLARWTDSGASNIELASSLGLPVPAQEDDSPWGTRCP